MYGAQEFTYAEPFANALVENKKFRDWVLQKTKFSACFGEAHLLHEEMMATRGKSAKTWWRSYYTEKCRCEGCKGQETDMLAMFEDKQGKRFALHIEVKQPTDKFPAAKDQAQNYIFRSQCWIKSPPKSVLPHDDADTILLCSAARLDDYAPHLDKFGAVITFEEVADAFPEATQAVQ